MKKLKISMLALVFTFGIGGAVVQKIQAEPKATEATYNWSGSGPDGNGTTSGTIEQAEDFYGCSGNAAVCATGVNQQDPLDVATIRLNQ
jgi:hypothetical protein